ncbi:hypothetical protein ACJX0J_027364, partial [Zea mays]
VACTRDSSRATTDEWFLIQEHTDECVPLFQILSLEYAIEQYLYSIETEQKHAQELQVNLITQVLLHFTKIDIHLHTIITSQDQKTSDDPLCNSKKGNSSNCREGSSNNILKDGCSTLLTASIVSVIFVENLSKMGDVKRVYHGVTVVGKTLGTCWDKNSLILV